MRGAGWIIAIVIAAAVPACTAPDDWFGAADDGYPDESQKIADAADWAAAETVSIELSEFEYSPETLRFRAGRPYALRLTNAGRVAHRFMARGFFRAVAVKSMVYDDAEAGYPLLEAVALEPRETKTLYFVAITPGDYHVSCDQPLHAVFGMAGRILVE